MLPQEMYVNYLRRRRSDLVELERALASAESEPFRRLGHQMKGNASSFGFADLAQLAEDIEKASPGAEPDAAGKLVGLFREWILRKEAEYFPK